MEEPKLFVKPRKTVLMYDDDRSITLFISSLIHSKLGHKTIIYNDLRKCLEFVDNPTEPFDLLLTDLGADSAQYQSFSESSEIMRRFHKSEFQEYENIFTGHDLIKKVKENYPQKIITLSGCRTYDSSNLPPYSDYHFQKPIDGKELLKTIQDSLN